MASISDPQICLEDDGLHATCQTRSSWPLQWQGSDGAQRRCESLWGRWICLKNEVLDWCWIFPRFFQIFGHLFLQSRQRTPKWLSESWVGDGRIVWDWWDWMCKMHQNANMDLFKQRWKWLSINKAHLESPFLILQCLFYATGNLLSGFWFDPLALADLSGFEWIVPLPQGTNLPQTWRRSHHLRLSFVARCCPCVCFANYGVIKICLVLEQLALQN